MPAAVPVRGRAMPYDRGHMNDRGQSLAEYALIVALIVIVALVALTLFGTQIDDILSIISDTING